jgi:hypothetical protein
MKNVAFSGHYIGADIVEPLIKKNREQYANTNRQFEVLDITTDDLPTVDLIFARDCLVHLSVSEIFDAIDNIRASGSTYLLATTYFWQTRDFNHDITTGDWRRLNLHQSPFNFPFPQEVIIEGSIIDNHRDKSLGLWKINKLPHRGGK